MYFGTKNYLKSNHNHTVKYSLRVCTKFYVFGKLLEYFFLYETWEIFLDYVPQYRVIYHFLNYILNQLQYYLKSLIYLLCQIQTPHYQFHENTME